MNGDIADFHGLTFETDYLLFIDEFEEVPAVYVIYTPKVCLEIGETDNLKEAIETHINTKKWVELSAGQDIYVAIHFEEEPASRVEKQKFLQGKMKPLIK